MNSLVIINHYAGCPSYGMRYRDYDIAIELKKKGWKVAIIAASFSHLRMKNPACESEVIDGIFYYWIKVPTYRSLGVQRMLNMMLFTFNLYRKRIKLPFEPDFIIASSPSPFTILNGIHYKRKYKAKFIYEIRDIWPLSIIELKGTNKYHPLIVFFGWLDNLGLKHSDAVLSPLGQISRYIKHRGYKKKVMVVPNGIADIKIGVEARRTKSGNAFVVGYGGSLSDSNSIMNLIYAADILKNRNIEFRIVGTGERYDDIQAFITSQRLTNIALMGHVVKEDFFNIMDSCDILYKGNPKRDLYKYGVSSIKMVEYLLLKKPIIDASYGVDIVQKSGAGIIVEPENEESLAKGILKFRDMDAEKRNTMARKGFEYAKKHFLYSNTVKSMELELSTL